VVQAAGRDARELLPGQMLTSTSRGPIDTPMIAKSKENTHKNDGPPPNNVANVPMGREGKADEVAELIAWLLCDGSSYMTGTVQMIDGGWAC
jgi:NAD(P)-dependent dehydrogenase (short-subunit alcohol dehydrogenase family)